MSTDETRPAAHEYDLAKAAIFASAAWPLTAPFAPLWEANVVFADGPPDHVTAAAFIAAALERHRLSAEAFADALLSDASREDLDSATAVLEESIVDLGLARTMVTKQSGDDPNDDDGWQIGFAEHAEFADDILPPLFVLPVSVPLGVALLESEDTTVRARDVHVYSEGLLVTVDVAITRSHEMPLEKRLELEHALGDVVEYDDTDDEVTDRPRDRDDSCRLVSASSRTSTRAGVAQWDYWVPVPTPDTRELRLRNPLADEDEFWHVAIDGARVDEARLRVIDLRAVDEQGGRDTGV
jgi:hypothetical protein